MGMFFYHVVTNKSMRVGQIIKYDENNHSGVYDRVYKLEDTINKIYANPNEYDENELDHHTKVALRELAMEEVRWKYYPNYPSRLECLYVSDTLEDAKFWFDYFRKLGRVVYQIVKVKTDGRIFKGDACNCFDGSTNKDKNIELAKKYWEGKDNDIGKTPIYETIIDGNIEVIDIIEEVNSFDKRSSVCDD